MQGLQDERISWTLIFLWAVFFLQVSILGYFLICYAFLVAVLVGILLIFNSSDHSLVLFMPSLGILNNSFWSSVFLIQKGSRMHKSWLLAHFVCTKRRSWLDFSRRLLLFISLFLPCRPRRLLVVFVRRKEQTWPTHGIFFLTVVFIFPIILYERPCFASRSPRIFIER